MKAFKFRYVNEITGLFVLSAVFLLIFLILAAGFVQGWFVPRSRFYTVFSTQEGTFGLQRGAEVHIFNTTAGNVDLILPNPEGEIEARFNIKKAFQKFIHVDSSVVVKKKFGIAGDSYLEILPGDPKKNVLEENSPIPFVKEKEVMETARELLKEFQDSLKPILKKFETSLDMIPPLLTQARETFQKTQNSIGDVRDALLPSLAKLDKILTSVPEILKALEGTLKDGNALVVNLNNKSVPAMDQFQAILSELKTVIFNIRSFSEKLNSAEMNLLMQELPSLSFSLEKTMGDAQRVLEGAQKHWLLKKYVEDNSPKKDPYDSVEK